MTVPTLKQQRVLDTDLLYDPAMFWVHEANTAAVDGAFYVRESERKTDDGDQEGRPRQRDVMEVLVRKSDWPAPAYQEMITVAGTDWTVVLASQENAREWRLVLEQNVGFGF